MDLLSLLMGSMTSQSSVGQVSAKTGLSGSQIRKLIMLALPILLKYMTRNASSGEGAGSLLGALSQHTDNKGMELQLEEADEDDGGKIISHILGKKEGKVTRELADKSGLSIAQVSKILAILAPALMCGVSAAAGGASQSQKEETPSISLDSASGIFGALLGGGRKEEEPAEKDQMLNGMALLQALLKARG